MKRLGVFALPPGWDAGVNSTRRYFFIYLGEERQCEEWSVLPKMRIQCSRLGLELGSFASEWKAVRTSPLRPSRALLLVLNKLILTEDVFLFGSRKTSNLPSLTLVSLYSLVGRLGMYSA